MKKYFSISLPFLQVSQISDDELTSFLSFQAPIIHGERGCFWLIGELFCNCLEMIIPKNRFFSLKKYVYHFPHLFHKYISHNLLNINVKVKEKPKKFFSKKNAFDTLSTYLYFSNAFFQHLFFLSLLRDLRSNPWRPPSVPPLAFN